jgi:hypothetical protein
MSHIYNMAHWRETKHSGVELPIHVDTVVVVLCLD